MRITKASQLSPSDFFAEKGEKGFTLLEVIISVTIMSLVVAVLYLAFSTGVRVWTKQEGRTNFIQQEFIVSQLFLRDFEKARPYTFNFEKGKGFFFGGDTRTVFYATSNGFASRDRDKGELFFACAFLRDHEDKNGSTLYLYKTPYPVKELFETFTEFRTQGSRPEFRLSEEIREESIVLLEDLDPAGFVYANPKRLQLKGDDDNSTSGISGQDDDNFIEEISDSTWSKNSLPDNVQFIFGLEDLKRSLYAKVAMAVSTEEKK